MISVAIERIILILGLVLIGGCASPVKHDQPTWVVVSSPRFEILSSMDAEDTVELARNLEQFHALVFKLTTANRAAPKIPTRIFAFSQGNQYSGSLRPDAAGFFQPGMRENTIVLSGRTVRWMVNNIVLHEYVHFIVRNASSTKYPIWYGEGFAELLSTARVHQDRIAIGLIPKIRYGSLAYGKWLPMSRVISAKRYEEFSKHQLGMFYAQSWALVHYLTLQRGKGSDMVRDLGSYLLRVGMGVSAERAFIGAYGESPEAMEPKLRALLKKYPDDKHPWRVVGVPITELDYDRSEPTFRTPTSEEVALRLGQLSLSTRDYTDAEAYFLESLESSPTNSRAYAGLGDALKFQMRWDEAKEYFLEAVQIGPMDVLNQLDLSEYYYDLAFAPDHSGDRRALLEKALSACLRGRALDASMPEVLAQLGRLRLAIGEDPNEGVELLKSAFESLPSSPTILYFLAEAYVATNRDDLARELLSRSVAVHSSGELDLNLDERIGEIRKRLRRTESAGPDSNRGDPRSHH